MLQVNKAALIYTLNEAVDRFMYELDSVKISAEWAEYLKTHLQYCCIIIITLWESDWCP